MVEMAWSCLRAEGSFFLAADAGHRPRFQQHIPVDVAECQLAEVIETALFKELHRAEGKRELMERFRAEYAQLRASWSGDPARWRGYDQWVARANNAAFGTQAAYDGLVPGFEALFQRNGGDWQRFYDAARQLAQLPKEERHRQLKEAPGG